MPRRNRPPVREIEPDPRYGSTDLAKFINNLMLHGKKSTATRIVYGALDIAEQRLGQPGIEIFNTALERAMPRVEVRPRRVGGATYQVPMEVRFERKQALGMRWLINHARQRGGRDMASRLAQELIETINGESATIKRRDDTHRMADANRAFTHFR
ncbi:MAG: 30S ribosomal protein S7 [Caldilineaceae bacterium SB0662_bin_9]|jgi:small subunit ribosomal protein S7|uniref:Small ribosomal subunit protein uS7 n=1 Tax=Caldilineaceae bacterium SB0662_bin_9 TaxID=2605258 RepID=A0A6B1DXP6_9CHLR|nr:30S ribosomal protein S7 [Caldilineaceae bacterium]MXZ24596.1 30S ribosomal protein S7 [Caldilineaceae bacterium SB0665_bin_21]MXZ41231.1 30S ribosomal protein S7 [Caldilineaceae bacterium SB0666_bin_21]MYA03386.1 30S ribosomal protein S7 [Caldilineaceae bacterium SB0664_bin_22]MYC63758.1 30S ribosomal protein S7 [Caldilineaceae bacterium SB0661_bin_34]MYD91806.1 30S ribosomal protein S7 [Caldilineaceae bacterium SB0662_bin_9]